MEQEGILLIRPVRVRVELEDVVLGEDEWVGRGTWVRWCPANVEGVTSETTHNLPK